MEKMLNSKQRLFEIAKKFQYEKAKKKDFIELAEILIFDTPYTNSIISKTKPEEINIVYKKSKDRDGRFVYDSNTVELSFSPRYAYFVEAILVISHEFTHFFQQKVNLIEKSQSSNCLKVKPKTKALLLACDCSSNGLEAFKTLYFGDYLNPDLSRYEIGQLESTLYLQFFPEENARKCSFQFAKELLDCMRQDPLCSQELDFYLHMNQSKLNQMWQKEIKTYNKNYYDVRRLYKEGYDQLSQNSYFDLLNISDPGVYSSIIFYKLAKLREENPTKERYFVDLFKSSTLLLDRMNCYKGIDKNLRDMTIDYLTSGKNISSKDIEILLFYIKKNNKLEKPKDFLTLQDIPMLCKAWIKNNSISLVNTFVDSLTKLTLTKHISKKDMQKDGVGAYLTKDEVSSLYWALVEDKELEEILIQKDVELTQTQNERERPRQTNLVLAIADNAILQTEKEIASLNLQFLRNINRELGIGRTAYANVLARQENKINLENS